ncbi:MAG: hypothetical protein V3T09_06745 [bacterium]
MIEYKINDAIKPGELGNFFQGWKSPPSIEIKWQGHLRLSFCVSEDMINKAFDRMDEYFK